MSLLVKVRLWVFAAFALIASAVGVQAQPVPNCTGSTPGLAFGAVDVLGTAVKDSSANITISCTNVSGLLNSISMTIHIGDGTGGSATGGPRRMTGSTTNMTYELYRDTGRTQTWGGTGVGSHGGTAFSVTGANLTNLMNGQSITVPIYGRVPGAQSGMAPGSYLSTMRPVTDVRLDYTTCTLLLLCTNRTSSFGFPITASVAANCRVVADELNFGTHGVLNANIDAASAIRVTCTNATSYSVGVGYGLSGTSVNNRRMRSTLGNFVNYQLYRNSGRTQVWGLLADGLTTLGGGTGGQQTYTVYGRVPPQATPRPDPYADTVTVTVTY